MDSDAFVPADFAPPTSLAHERFRLEPLGPQHNEADLAAWTSSVPHIRATPGYPDGSWPPPEGMTPERNRQDLERHAADFAARRGCTATGGDAYRPRGEVSARLLRQRRRSADGSGGTSYARAGRRAPCRFW